MIFSGVGKGATPQKSVFHGASPSRATRAHVSPPLPPQRAALLLRVALPGAAQCSVPPWQRCYAWWLCHAKRSVVFRHGSADVEASHTAIAKHHETPPCHGACTSCYGQCYFLIVLLFLLCAQVEVGNQSSTRGLKKAKNNNRLGVCLLMVFQVLQPAAVPWIQEAYYLCIKVVGGTRKAFNPSASASVPS